MKNTHHTSKNIISIDKSYNPHCEINWNWLYLILHIYTIYLSSALQIQANAPWFSLGNTRWSANCILKRKYFYYLTRSCMTDLASRRLCMSSFTIKYDWYKWLERSLPSFHRLHLIYCSISHSSKVKQCIQVTNFQHKLKMGEWLEWMIQNCSFMSASTTAVFEVKGR